MIYFSEHFNLLLHLYFEATIYRIESIGNVPISLVVYAATIGVLATSIGVITTNHGAFKSSVGTIPSSGNYYFPLDGDIPIVIKWEYSCQ